MQEQARLNGLEMIALMYTRSTAPLGLADLQLRIVFIVLRKHTQVSRLGIRVRVLFRNAIRLIDLK